MPKHVDRDKKIAEITMAALKLFAQKGFDGTSIRDLSSELKMSKGSLYAYFKSKEDILNHAAQQYLANFASQVKAIPDTNARDRIRALFHNIFDTIDRKKEMTVILYDLMLITHRGGLPEVRPVVFKMIEDFRNQIKLEIEAGKKQGTIRKSLDTSAAADALTALVDGIAVHYIWMGKKSHINSVIDIFLEDLM